MLIVFTSCSEQNEAENLARMIVESKLAACVQILPKIKSFYFWDGEVQDDSEYLLLIKTLVENYPQVEDFIKENHSYDLPEVVAIKANVLSDDYFNWIKNYLNESS